MDIKKHLILPISKNKRFTVRKQRKFVYSLVLKFVSKICGISLKVNHLVKSILIMAYVWYYQLFDIYLCVLFELDTCLRIRETRAY